jgi:hypothetical protein
VDPLVSRSARPTGPSIRPQDAIVVEFGRKCVDRVHAHRKLAFVFPNDHLIGMQPWLERFKDLRFDGIRVARSLSQEGADPSQIALGEMCSRLELERSQPPMTSFDRSHGDTAYAICRKNCGYEGELV